MLNSFIKEDNMVDIIIPAKNAHNTIKTTLSSIQNQEESDNIKVYIIDDASDEDYKYLLNEFTNLSIEIIELKHNCGPGVARNIGIENSHGNAVLFLDADDELMSCTSIKNMHNLIDKNDIVIGITRVINKDGTVYDFSDDEFNVHGKMYRRKYIDKYMFRFPETRRHEDRIFHQTVLTSKPQIAFLNEFVYLYRYNENSITRKDSLLDEAKSIKELFFSTEKMIDCVINKKLDYTVMTKHLLESIVYAYSLYNYFYDDKIADDIKLWSIKTVEIYKKYSILLNEDEKENIFNFILNQDKNNMNVDFRSFIESGESSEHFNFN